jgi:RNA polymerase sigma-70 factor (ECF subfamily)
MHQPETRPSLILRLKGERNEPAWTEFVFTYESFLRQLVARQGVAERDAADVTQQLLAAIARSVEGWQDDGSPASFRRWLHRVARNVVIKFLARERRQVHGRGGTDFYELLQDVPQRPSEDQVRAYEHELVVWAAHQVRDEFQETSWKAFWETLVAGRAVGDVARELGVTPGSIYMSRSRIMARIRAKIREVDDETA